METPGADTSPIAGLAPASTQFPDVSYKDRSTALIVFGIIEIAGGGIAALFVPFSMLAILAAARKGNGLAGAGPLAVSAITYGMLAAILVTLGIGSTMARRWAQALNLILSWIWVIFGVVATVVLAFVVPSSFSLGMQRAAQQNPNAGNVSTGFMAAVVTFFIVFAAVFLVFLPIVFLFFYRSRNVIETCRHRDPVERWTDRRPLPIIAFALAAAGGSAYYLITSVAVPVFPLFGRYLTGLSATPLLLLFAVVDCLVAVFFLRLKVLGWWLALIFSTLRTVSLAITLVKVNISEAYSHIGWSSEQLEVMKATPLLRSGAFLWWPVLFMVLYLAFLVWLKRFFHPVVTPSYTSPGSEIVLPSQPES
jgi:uncharacterized membrane protein